MNISNDMPADTAATATGNSLPFSDAMRGRSPHAEDLQLPSLLSDLYAVANDRKASASPAISTLSGTWRRMDDATVRNAGIDPALLHDEKSGFDAAFYQDANGHVALAFCGTDEGRDWNPNVRQGLGLEDPQYESAIALADQAKQVFGKNLVMTGHSLGGGLAAAASMVNDVPAVTYNAAGVHDHTLERHGLDAQAAKDYAKEGLIRGYHVDNEILTHLQEDSFPIRYAMPDAAGHQIELPDPDPLSVLERLVPGKMLGHRLDLHGIEAVMQSQSLQQLRAREAAPAHPANARAADDTANTLLRDAVAVSANSASAWACRTMCDSSTRRREWRLRPVPMACHASITWCPMRAAACSRCRGDWTIPHTGAAMSMPTRPHRYLQTRAPSNCARKRRCSPRSRIRNNSNGRHRARRWPEARWRRGLLWPAEAPAQRGLRLQKPITHRKLAFPCPSSGLGMTRAQTGRPKAPCDRHDPPTCLLSRRCAA